MMRSIPLRGMRAGLVLCLGLAVMPLSAQGSYAGQVTGQLDEAEAMVIAEGYTRDGQSEGWMPSGGVSTTAWSLIPGEWAVVGACDEDCGDLDLEAVTASGQRLDGDAEADALPVLAFAVDALTEVTLRLTMPECGTPRCYVGYRWYHRETGEGGGEWSWRAVVGAQLGMIDLDGASLDHERLALLDADGVDSFSVDLSAGAYMAVAVCDADCTDVDLFVRNQDGRELGRDVLDDDVPVVEFDAGGGRYRFEVAMQSCSTSSCGYGFRLYRKGG